MVYKVKLIWIVLVALLLNVSCANDNEDSGDDKDDLDNLTEMSNLIIESEDQEDPVSNGMMFPYTKLDNTSDYQKFTIKGEHLTSEITVSLSSDDYEISTNNIDYNTSITIPSNQSNNTTIIYVRFTPKKTGLGNIFGTININNQEADNANIILTGKTAINGVINYLTFDKERVANGGGYSQTSRKTFTLHSDNTNIESIMMYVKLTCPDEGCDEWDVFANVKINDPISGEDYELARFITPYWNDNSQLIRGFEFDVTDFKSILIDEVELRIRTECWNAKGYEVSIDFDYKEGTPDYAYYAITRVFNYDNGSASGVPYGITHNMDLTREISIPTNAESTYLRTFVHGWGQAEPADADGRRCAEWCYRTHQIKINGADTFEHSLDPLGCATNPVSNQDPGNWTADRAGWCPGMAIPTRIDEFTTSKAGETFSLEYSFEDWINDETKDAYYPISTFVVVKSNTQIERATVID